MSVSKTIVSPVPFEVEHNKDSYTKVKIEIDLPGGTYRKRELHVWSSKRGVEGFLYCWDLFKKVADKFRFDADDYETYFPEMLDEAAQRSWNTRWSVVPALDRTVDRFLQEVDSFITRISGSDIPRDDLIEYIRYSSECRKKRNSPVLEHVDRIEQLCLIANRLHGDTPDLTPDQITSFIFESFPEPWKDGFTLNCGRATLFSRQDIITYFENKKKIQDKEEEQQKKKRKEEKEKKHEASPPKKQKPVGQGNQGNKCQLHNGAHPWLDCLQNPKSTNYFLNPRSPFYCGRGRGAMQGGGQNAGGQFGRGNFGCGGGGGGVQQNDNYFTGNSHHNNGTSRDQGQPGGNNTNHNGNWQSQDDHYHNEPRGAPSWY